MAGMALHPIPGHFMLGPQNIDLLPEIDIR